MLRLAVVFAFALTASLTEASEIHWEVEHPFRYFKQHSDLWLQQEALKQLEEEDSDAAKFAPISHIERKLNNPSWWKDNPELLGQLKQLRVAEGRSAELDLRFGWGSFLTNSAPVERGDINQICWNARSQSYTDCDRSELHGTTGDDEFIERAEGNKRHKIRQGRYIYPKFHRIVLSLKDNPNSNTTCVWTATAPIFLAADDKFMREREIVSAPCGDTIPARVKYSPEAPEDQRGVDVNVEVQDAAGSVVETPQDAHVRVRDILVFALGDSYSSGEGNPEIPAKLHPTRAIGPAQPKGADLGPVTSKKFYGIPRRSPPGGSEAKWTDRRCHRSVYSYQTRVALQLAIAPDKDGNRHHSVTYLQFTCSGAEVTEDILYSWEGRECLEDAMNAGSSNDPYHAFYMPQISKASLELCQLRQTTVGKLQHWWFSSLIGKSDLKLKPIDHYLGERTYFAGYNRPACNFSRWSSITRDPRLWFCEPTARARPIDLVLTTAGGNDIGFAKVVAKAIVDQNQQLLQVIGSLPVIGAALDRALFVDRAEAKLRTTRLPHRLLMYDEALEQFLGVKSSDPKKSPVLAMAYPSLIYKRDVNTDNRFCPGGNTIADVSKFLGLNAGFLRDVEKIVEDKCNASGQNCGLIDAIRVNGKKYGWRVIDSHRDLFRSHGICVTDPAASPNESGQKTAEIPGIPYKLVDLTKPLKDQYADPWKRYDPVTQYYPYESRKSGFRTPVQDFMNIHYFKEAMPDSWVEDERASAIALAQRILGGSFHPTAEAHSHIADHVYCQAREQLFGETCDVQKVLTHAHPW